MKKMQIIFPALSFVLAIGSVLAATIQPYPSGTSTYKKNISSSACTTEAGKVCAGGSNVCTFTDSSITYELYKGSGACETLMGQN